MIFRRKDRDRANPGDLLQRLHSLHELLDPTLERTVEDDPAGRREPAPGARRAAPLASPDDVPAPFDDDLPLLLDVVAPEDLPERPAAAPAVPARPLGGDAEVVRALAAFELAVSRHLGHEHDPARNQVMRTEIRRSLTRMLAELEARWKVNK
jgi:hypothetical protein